MGITRVSETWYWHLLLSAVVIHSACDTCFCLSQSCDSYLYHTLGVSDRHRQTDSHRQTNADRDRQTVSDTDRQTQTGTDRQTRLKCSKTSDCISKSTSETDDLIILLLDLLLQTQDPLLNSFSLVTQYCICNNVGISQLSTFHWIQYNIHSLHPKCLQGQARQWYWNNEKT